MEKMDIDSVLESLDSMSAMIKQLRDTLSGDSAEEQAAEVDDATMESEMATADEESIKSSEGSKDKDLKKAAAVAMLKKQLG